MIAKAKSISHGINDISYITGESRNKKHPERIFHVKDNLLPSGLDATGIWDSMRLTLEKSKRVKNSVIRIEVSPAPEHTKDFTVADWEKLWDDFMGEFDSIELCDRNGRTYSPKTNLTGSKGTVRLHLESKSGLPHLHGAFCRIDEQEYRASEPGLHGNPAIHGKLVMAGIRRPVTGQGLRALGTAGRQEHPARLCLEERQRPVQGFRTRQGAQPHGKQARKHVEETARGSQDKDRSGATRCRHTITDCNPNYSG